MAASKLGFLDQPNSTIQGYTLTGASQDSVNLVPNHGIRVAVQDSTGATVTTDNSTVTIAFGTNPTSGSVLQGTLSRQAVNGVATFYDLAVSLGGSGYTLTVSDGALSTATSNAFSITNVSRINPAILSSTITTTGLANGVGPYRYRGGNNMFGIVVETTSATAGDAATVWATPPGVALAAGTGASLTTITAQPGYKLIQLANDCDIYVSGTTIATTMTVFIESAQSTAHA